MKSRPKVLALVMAGGEGSRLHPLTAERCKPSVPFGGSHLLVDFVLSNLVNSGIHAIYLLVQYKSQALIEHVHDTWAATRALPGHFVTIVPPQMHRGKNWFEGTADSVAQNLHLIERYAPDLVAVFGADHVCRMDVRHMVDFHVEQGADVSIATLPVPVAASPSFGIVEIDADQRVRRFDEKPSDAHAMPGSTTHALASMGNYLFDARVLLDALRQPHGDGDSDFGQHVLPLMLESHRLMAYDYTTHTIPGTQPGEDPHYWRDVGTIDAYFDAHFDTLGANPRFRMSNPHWPIHASPDQAAAAQVEHGRISHSSLGAGSIVSGAALDHAMLRHAVRVDADAMLERCIVLDRTRIGRGARLRRVIVDEDNDIPPFETVGYDSERDRQRFHLTDSGIVVVPARHYPAHH